MPDVDNTEEFRCISLCTGYAGLELGLKRVIPALRTVCYVEVEAFACANLVAKIEAGELDAAPIWTDIKTFDGRPFLKRVHIITAGFPCQPFSVAGKRQGGTDERNLWPHIERIIKAVKPVWVFLENVSGLLSARTLDNRPDLCRYLTNLATLAKVASTARKRWYLSEHIRRLTGYLLRTEGIPAYASVYFSLRNLGYKVEAGLFTAAECGAPHKRERLFILAKSRTYGRRRGADGISGRLCGSLQTQRPSELANSSRAASGNQDGQAGGRARQEDVPQGNGKIGSVRIGAASELADTAAQRIQGSIPESSAQAGRQVDQQSNQWPSRPGQPQYEWEEPRVVAESTRQGLQRGIRKPGEPSKSPRQAQGEGGEQTNRPFGQSNVDNKGQAQSRLGRAANGIASGLDSIISEYKVGYCAKVTVISFIITEKDEIIYGFNACKNPQEVCPREQGEGYEKCKTVCKQIRHSEVVACQLAGEKAKNGCLYLLGHTYFCDECIEVMEKAGLRKYVILPTPKPQDNRVDRLRLLGNGVVPQQAEKAFRELIKLF